MGVFNLNEDVNLGNFREYYMIPYVVKSVYDDNNFDLYNINDKDFFDKYDFIYEMDMFLSIYREEIIRLKESGFSLSFAIDEINNMISNEEEYREMRKCSLKRFLLYEGMSLDEYVKELYFKNFNDKEFNLEYNKILSLYGRVLSDEFIKIKDKYAKLFSKDICSVSKKSLVLKR